MKKIIEYIFKFFLINITLKLIMILSNFILLEKLILFKNDDFENEITVRLVSLRRNITLVVLILDNIVPNKNGSSMD